MEKNARFQIRVKQTTLEEFNKLVNESNFSNEGFLLELMELYKKNKEMELKK